MKEDWGYGADGECDNIPETPAVGLADIFCGYDGGERVGVT